MFFPHVKFHSRHLFLFHSCTSSLITSPQYLVSRFSHSLCKILTLSSMTQSRFATVRFCHHSHSFHNLVYLLIIVLFLHHSLVLFCFFFPQSVFLITGSAALFVLAPRFVNKSCYFLKFASGSSLLRTTVLTSSYAFGFIFLMGRQNLFFFFKD